METMIKTFKNSGTEDIYYGLSSRLALKICSNSLWSVARRKLDQISHVKDAQELRIPPGNRFESLRGNRSGQYSIRVNDQYRICFRWEGIDAYDVEITDYHK